MSDDTERQARKAAAAVEFTLRRLDHAEEAIVRAQSKVTKAQEHVAAAQSAVDAAVAERDAIAAELAALPVAAAAPANTSSSAGIEGGAQDASIVTESPEG
jgi:hypothetical protein